MTNTYLLPLLIFLSVTISGYSQQFASRHLSPEEGLPSSEVYRVIQDSADYIWIATDQGVCRFDGQGFTYFSTNDGLPDEAILGFGTDDRKRLWVYGTSRKLAYFEHGQFHAFALNKYLEHLDPNIGVITMISPISKDSVYVSFTNGHPLLIASSGNQRIGRDTTAWGELTVSRLSRKRLSVGTTSFRDRNTKRVGLPFMINLDGLEIEVPDSITWRSVFYGACQLEDESVLLGFTDHLIRISKDGETDYRELPDVSRIIAVKEDRDGNIWAGTASNGVFCFPNGDLNAKPLQILRSYSVSSIFQDHEGGYWFSTLEDGVFYYPNFLLPFWNDLGTKSPAINCLLKDAGYLYLGMKGGELVRMPWHGVNANKTEILNRGDELRALYKGPKESIAYVRLGPFSYTLYQHPDILFQSRRLQQVVKRDEFFEYLITKNSVSLGSKENPAKAQEIARFSHIHETERCADGGLWVGAEEGLFRITSNAELVNLSAVHPDFGFPVRAMDKYPGDNTLLVALNDHGVRHLNNGVSTEIRLEAKGQPLNVNSIFIDSNQIGWLGTNNGLFRLDSLVIGKDTVTYRLQQLNTKHGLVSSSIQQVQVVSDTVFLATNKGLQVFNKRLLTINNQGPSCVFNSVEINAKPIDAVSDLTLSYDQNDLTIKFAGLAYRNDGDVLYRYRLKGLEENWIYGQSTLVRFPNLPPGAYRFEVMASNEDGVWGQPSAFSIQIEPPYWTSGWFLFLLITVAAVIVFTVFWIRIRVIRREYELLQELRQTEQKALRAQMNPHFVFNSLNSIQKFILDADPPSAQKYLNVFARIIRQALHHSVKSFVSIQAELELLKDYVSLEGLRLNEPIDFRIEIDPDLNPYVMEIPPMLLQPFVENAIWHGVLPHKKQGRIDLILRRENADTLFCEIRDNGVGRPQEVIGKSTFSKESPSGMQITDDRVRLLWKQYGLDQSIKVVDLKNEDGSPAGTSVSFLVPLEF